MKEVHARMQKNLVLKKDAKFKVEYIAAVLNSDLINWYYSTNFSNKSKLTVNISRTYLQEIPIKIISVPDQQKFVELVSMLSNLKTLSITNNDDNSTKLKIQTLEDELNDNIYKLYDITEEEKKIIESI